MKLTYLKLLQMVAEKKQPKKIKVFGHEYEWNGSNDYVGGADNKYWLSQTMADWSMIGQVGYDNIIVVHDLLTEEEKAYLKSVIKPFFKAVIEVEKSVTDDGEREYIEVKYKENLENHFFNMTYDYLIFPTFKKGEMYKGMEVDWPYSIEELGLTEDEKCGQ